MSNEQRKSLEKFDRLKKKAIEEFLGVRYKDRMKMLEASREIDGIREKYGAPEKGFDSVLLIRKFRESR